MAFNKCDFNYTRGTPIAEHSGYQFTIALEKLRTHFLGKKYYTRLCRHPANMFLELNLPNILARSLGQKLHSSLIEASTREVGNIATYLLCNVCVIISRQQEFSLKILCTKEN